MKRTQLSKSLKELVANRASNKCEYCQLSDKLSFYNFHIEHIKSLKHGGKDDNENLAYSCPDCNFNKGTDLGSSNLKEELIRFYNPRKDVWIDHFKFVDGEIIALTEIGKVTEKIFRFNEVDRVLFRREIIKLQITP